MCLLALASSFRRDELYRQPAMMDVKRWEGGPTSSLYRLERNWFLSAVYET